MVDELYPIRISRDTDGEYKILLLDEWYDALKPVYDFFDSISGAAKITNSPIRLGAAAEFFNHLIVEFEARGWGVAISLFAILKQAALDRAQLVKFTYEQIGYGERYGESYGGGTTIREVSTTE